MAKFNLGYTQLTTADMGVTFPVQIQEVLPGDRFRGSTSIFSRFSPMLAPIMHPVYMKLHHWYVPLRLIWDEFEDFITAGNDGIQAPEVPYITADATNGFTKGSLADYFGLPVGSVHKGIKVSALPFRAMCLIYNEFYRDQDIQSERAISYSSGSDTITDISLFNSDWRKDYFTTARTSTQRGVSVSVPVAVNSDNPTTTLYYGYKLRSRLNPTSVTANPSLNSSRRYCVLNPSSFSAILSGDTGVFTVEVGVSYMGDQSFTKVSTLTLTFDISASNLSKLSYQDSPVVTSGNLYGFDYRSTNYSSTEVVSPGLWWLGEGSILGGYSDTVSNAGSFDIRDLRIASAVQRYQERSLKYGNRYNEYLISEWGVKPSDARLQLPEYLGGGKQWVQFSEVLQTAESTDNPVGTMRGHGVGVIRSNRYRRTFPEHGIMLTLCTYQPVPIYTQGLDRMWIRKSKFDYFTRELDAVGMEEVLQQELYATSANEDVVFGYQDRYDSYRRRFSKVTGDFRDTLNFWHLARNFSSAPVLNDSFLKCVPSKRVFADTSSNPLWLFVQNSCIASRKIPKRAKNILK